jgi:hypothetical protein
MDWTGDKDRDRDRTYDHDIEIEALADRLAVPLIGQIGKSNISRQLPPDDIGQLGRLLVRHKRRGGPICVIAVHFRRSGRGSCRWRRR